MKHFYFFVSSCPNDKINRLNLFTDNIRKAYALAYKIFAKNNCKGLPRMLAI